MSMANNTIEIQSAKSVLSCRRPLGVSALQRNSLDAKVCLSDRAESNKRAGNVGIAGLAMEMLLVRDVHGSCRFFDWLGRKSPIKNNTCHWSHRWGQRRFENPPLLD